MSLLDLSTEPRGFGLGILPDEADKAGVCHYSSERLTAILAHWCEHNLDLANRVMALTAENEDLRSRLDALEMSAPLDLQTHAERMERLLRDINNSTGMMS